MPEPEQRPTPERSTERRPSRARCAKLTALQEIDRAAGTVFAATAPFRTDGAASAWADHARDAEAGRLVGTAVDALIPRA
jgi:hypothetical protein